MNFTTASSGTTVTTASVNPQKISHEELHEKTLAAALKEKSATLALLEFLKQVDERRTFSVMGFPSMFKYVEEGLGYSPAQASERVAAMRLLRKVPEVATQLSHGPHTLTSVAKVASHVRRENLDADRASALVLETANLSITALEKHLCSVAEVEPVKLERARVISKELTRLTLDVDDAFMASVERMRELGGNPGAGFAEVFSRAMREFIQRRERKTHEKKPDVEKSHEKKPQEENAHERNVVREAPLSTRLVRDKAVANKTLSKETASKEAVPEDTMPKEAVSEEINPVLRPTEFAHSISPKRSRYIRASDRRFTRQQAGHSCEFVYEKTGRRCGTRYALQYEHVIPFSKGGENTQGNLKLYCAAHNRLRAIQEFGEIKMRPFLR